MSPHAFDHLVIISGCSGGGKSTLLAELERRGHTIVEEPGRRVIAQERARGGSAYPWSDPTAFALCALELARADHEWAAATSGLVFFDRGLVDAAVALEHATGGPLIEAVSGLHYNRRVFLTPPWPEIYVQDKDRRHDFDEAAAEYERLSAAYAALGYDIAIIPRLEVPARADFVLGKLQSS